MSASKELTDTLVLETGLFEDVTTLSAALRSIQLPESNRPESNWRTLNVETMNDEDWDEILSLVLSTKRVITL